MNKLKKIFYISFFKTIIFNIRYFGLKGLLFPCLVSKNTKFLKLSGNIFIKNPKFGKILIGFGPEQATNGIGRFYNTGIIYFDEEAHLYSGFYIYNTGNLKFGKNIILGSSKVFCEKEIIFGNEVMISWDCLIMDSDLHDIFKSENKINFNNSIFIGDHVWICCYSHIYKGSFVPSNSIVASDSHISNCKLTHEYCIYGNYGKVINNDITWSHQYTK